MLSTYIKEMKIASRGFYFYVEIVFAIIALSIVLLAVDENPNSKSREFLYNDLPEEVQASMLNKEVEEGNVRIVADTAFKLKPLAFQVLNKDTNELVSYDFKDNKTIMVSTLEQINPETGKIAETIYYLTNEEDMLRLSYTTGSVGATTTMNDQGELSYRYYLQGYETERYSNILYIMHTYTTDEVEAQNTLQVSRTLGISERMNNREQIVPIIVVFSGSLMGFFIIMSYIFLDKDEGVIRAFAVTPSSVWKYLFSKILVILTTMLISSSILVIPIMKLKPDYLMFYLLLLVSTFAFSAFGLLVASFFDSISKAFGVLYLVMIALMLPGFSYYISSFDPIWLRFFPTYPLLEGFKGILLGQTDVSYVLIYSLAFLISGVLLLTFANIRFKKTLTV